MIYDFPQKCQVLMIEHVVEIKKKITSRHFEQYSQRLGHDHVCMPSLANQYHHTRAKY